jgi:hypothetical protein
VSDVHELQDLFFHQPPPIGLALNNATTNGDDALS